MHLSEGRNVPVSPQRESCESICTASCSSLKSSKLFTTCTENKAVLQPTAWLVLTADFELNHLWSLSLCKHLISKLHSEQVSPSFSSLFFSLQKLVSLTETFPIRGRADLYLCVSQTGCSRDGLLHRLCFPSHVLALWAPVVAQQQVGDVCVALQSSMHQRTLAILISVSHLGTEGANKGPLTMPIKKSHPKVRSVCHHFPRIDPKSASGLGKDQLTLASDWMLYLHLIGRHSLPLFPEPNLKGWACHS